MRNTDTDRTKGVPGITLPAGLTAGWLPAGLAVNGPIGSGRKLVGIGMSMNSVLVILPIPNLLTGESS